MFPTAPLVNITDRDARRALTIALVGNGRGVIKHKDQRAAQRSVRGDKIDKHDLVGRFNFFVTAGYEKSCGTRTDLWFLNQLKRRGRGHSCPDCLLITHLCTLAASSSLAWHSFPFQLEC